MIERFLKPRKCIEKALRAVASTETLSQSQWNSLQNFLKCLHPVEIVRKRLCSEDASLLKADSSIYFLLIKLKSDNNSIAAQSHRPFLERYVSRRQNDALLPTSFLHHPKFLQGNYFPEFSKSHARGCGKKVFERLYNNDLSDSENEEINASTASEIVQTKNEEASFLKANINAMDNLSAQVEPRAKDANIHDELKCFEN